MVLYSQLAIAPMIDWTNTYFRIFMRGLAPHALLYTEMQTPAAIVHNPVRNLYFNPIEKPLAIQLGGADAGSLGLAAQEAEKAGYDEVNLNLGCPSNKVQAGRFGACLMREPRQVATIIRHLKDSVLLPVSAKIRIGVDTEDDYSFFAAFVATLIDAGCDKVIVHARKAWLQGLSPKQNRSIPPLHYDYVYRIKQQYPEYPLVINGNIKDVDSVQEHLSQVDGVMLGRLACDNPYAIANIHHTLYPTTQLPSRHEALNAYLAGIQDSKAPLSILLKPLYNLAHGLPYARHWKSQLMDIQLRGEHAALESIADYFAAYSENIDNYWSSC